MIEKDLTQNYLTELRRGSLVLAVLGCLTKPFYGYGLLQELQDKEIPIEANTLYPLLRRLEKQGLLTSDWDTSKSRPRKYYLINETGTAVTKELRKEWLKMQTTINTILKEEDE